MDPTKNPFAILSLIVAPAILTNASSVLIMSTSNRLARVVDRARELSKQLEAESNFKSSEAERRLRELTAAESRSLLLLRGLRSFYVALGCFATAALVSLLGSVLVPFEPFILVQLMELGGVVVGIAAVAALVRGSTLLLQETRIAVRIINERASNVRARLDDI
jgi:hypothetical protein